VRKTYPGFWQDLARLGVELAGLGLEWKDGN
jgi:hypothetical protein